MVVALSKGMSLELNTAFPDGDLTHGTRPPGGAAPGPSGCRGHGSAVRFHAPLAAETPLGGEGGGPKGIPTGHPLCGGVRFNCGRRLFCARNPHAYRPCATSGG